MKKALCILTALFAMSWASAQTSSSSQSQTGGSSDQSSMSSSQGTTKKGMKKGGERTLTGCLNKEGDDYVLEHGKRKIQVTSSEDLSKHVGHTVKLHGMFEKAAAGEATGTEKGEKKGGAREFKATSIDHVSDTCQAGAGMGEHKMNHHHKMGGTSGGGAASPSPSPSPQP